MHRVKIVILAVSLTLIGAWVPDAPTALAKKDGKEVRDEPAPTGRGPDIDDRRARNGRDDSDRSKSDSSGKGSGSSKRDDDDDSRGRGSSGSSGSSKSSGGENRGVPRGRVVIRDDDRL